MDPSWERATTRGDVDAVRELLAAGAGIDALDRYGQTALMLAAHRGHAALVEFLIGSGADLNVTAKFHLSAMMLAVVAGHAEIARRLAHAGADRALKGSGAGGFFGKTAYDLALEREMRDVLEDLQPG